MGGEVGVVMAAGVKVEFVGDMSSSEDFVEGGGASFEAEVVLIAEIEINFQASEICGTGESERAVLLPVGRINRIAEDTAEDASARRGSGGKGWNFLDEGGAVGADAGKKLGMAES